ncbi:hypothetical protein RCH06_003470, partial [Polaromonas sp. CG_9.5]|nr:hypothetical protein [Polaromonas sp. CG_9.5]
ASSALASLNASSALSGASLFSLAGLGELSSYHFLIKQAASACRTGASSY